MKKIVSLFLILFMVSTLLLSSLTVKAFVGGSCGENVWWSIDNNTLYVSGTGDMEDYENEYDVPWRTYKDDITNVSISDGVTSIGNISFFGCTNIETVIIPDGVIKIGHHAFAQCKNIKNISIPSTASSIGAYAFGGTGIEEITLPSELQILGDAAFLQCYNLKAISIPKKITTLSTSLFQDCSSLKDVVLSDGLIEIGYLAFSNCDKLTNIQLPSSVTTINASAFYGCKSIKNILLPHSINIIKDGAFQDCSSLQKIVIPSGVTALNKGTFYRCSNIKQISIPKTVLNISPYAFTGCNNLTDIYYEGTIQEWMEAVGSNGITEMADANVYYTTYVPILVSVIINGEIMSFPQSPVVIAGRTLIPLRAIFEAVGATVDWDANTQTITSTLDSTTIKLTIGDNVLYKNGIAVTLDVPAQLINGYTMVPVRAVAEAFGADVNWDDATQTVYITTKGNTYTVNTIPQIKYDGYNANFADFNGMYIDSFSHSTNGNGKENVKFDVYNTQYIYGIVEIYNANNELTDVAIIDKMSNSTSIKGVLIDDTGSLIKDLWNGTALTYRQASGYSKKTSINIDIPKGGYIKITNDMHESFIASAINLADMVFSAKSTFSTLNGFNSDTSKEFAYELSAKLVKEAAFSEMVKNPTKYTDKLWKNVGKELYMNSESIGGFLETISRNLDELADGKLTELIFSTAGSCGISIAEGTFEALAGPAGVALKAIFTINSVSDTLVEMNDGLVCLHQGSIKIKTV